MAERKLSTFERLRKGQMPRNRRERREIERRLNAPDPGLEIVYPDAAGIDVGQNSHHVCVPPGGDPRPVREFGCWTQALEEMAQWLRSGRIRTVVMQSTGVYWMGGYDVLQPHGLEVHLVDARATKNVPGRKSDVQECQWRMKLDTYGLLRQCFLPAPAVHAVWTVWRLREQHLRDAARCIQHMQKALTEMNVQLHVALSDISGVSGQAIIRAILAGQRDPKTLAALRDPRCQASEEEFVASLQGNWKPDVRFELQPAVDAYDFYHQQLARCDQQLRIYLKLMPDGTAKFHSLSASPVEPLTREAKQKKRRGQKALMPSPKTEAEPEFDLEQELVRILGVNPMSSIDGIGVVTVMTVISEVGADLSPWETGKRWVSWLNLAPKRDVSGGKVIRHVRPKHNNRIANAFRLGAQSLQHKDSYLGARFRYLVAKLGKPKAIKAMARYLACLYYRLITKGQAFVDQGAAVFEQKRRQRELASLERRAQNIGYKVVAA